MTRHEDIQDVIGRLKRRGEYEELASEAVAAETDELGFSLVGDLSDDQVASLWTQLEPTHELSTDETVEEIRSALAKRSSRSERTR